MKTFAVLLLACSYGCALAGWVDWAVGLLVPIVLALTLDSSEQPQSADSEPGTGDVEALSDTQDGTTLSQG